MGAMFFILRKALSCQLMREGGSSTYYPIRADLLSIMNQALPIGLNNFLFILGIFIVQVYLKRFGPEAIAAYGVGIRLQQFFMIAGTSHIYRA